MKGSTWRRLLGAGVRLASDLLKSILTKPHTGKEKPIPAPQALRREATLAWGAVCSALLVQLLLVLSVRRLLLLLLVLPLALVWRWLVVQLLLLLVRRLLLLERDGRMARLLRTIARWAR